MRLLRDQSNNSSKNPNTQPALAVRYVAARHARSPTYGFIDEKYIIDDARVPYGGFRRPPPGLEEGVNQGN